MTSRRKKRTRAPRPSLRDSSDQAELAALLHPSEPAALPPADWIPVAKTLAGPVEPAVELEQGPATFSIDEISTAVRYWGEDAQDKGAAKVSGGFGPKACLVIEVLTVMTLNREPTVACNSSSNLARLVNEALQANSPIQPIEQSVNADA